MIFIREFTNLVGGRDVDVISYADRNVKEEIAALFNLSKEKYNMFIGLDFETNGLCPILNTPLLLGIGLPDFQIAIECHKSNPFDLFPDDWQDYIYVAHNAKFDYSFAHFNHKVDVKRTFCTMVADQKISQNLKISNSLEVCLDKYLGVELTQPKDTRLEFIGKDPERDPYYKTTQLKYLFEDVKYLVPLKDRELKVANSYKLDNWLSSVELKLPRILGKAENRGIGFDWDGLDTLTANNEVKAYELAVELDKELQRLADTMGNKKYTLKGGVYTAPRNMYDPSAYQFDLFTGKPTEKGVVISTRAKKFPYKKATANTANINWNSEIQVLEIFAKLEEPLMIKDGSYAIPYLNENGKVYRDRGIVKKKRSNEYKKVFVEGFQTNKKAFAQYLIDKPNTKCKNLIELLVNYTKVNHEINAFGYGYMKKKNPVTGLIHTIYRQASTANSRFSSGGGRESASGSKSEMSYRYNSQNAPRDNKIRNLFRSPNYHLGWKVATCDLSGAEVTILCDKAHDETLYEMAVKNDDVHSPIVQNSWRYLFLYRAGVEGGMWHDNSSFFDKVKYGTLDKWADKIVSIKNKKANSLAERAKTFVVSKKVNKPYRQGGKNNTFGSIYNMGKKTAAATYNGTTAELRKVDPHAEPVNVTPDEAGIALWAIKKAIPKTFKFVEKQAKDALVNGYLILNTRSYSRAWFTSVTQLLSAVNSTIAENKSNGWKSYLQTIDTYNGVYELSTGEQFTLDWKEAKEVDGQARNLSISGTQADMIKESMVVIDHLISTLNLRANFLMQVHDELVYDYDPTMGDITYTYQGVTKINKFPELVKDVMSRVATAYLKHYSMHADVMDEDYWIK